MKVTVIPIVIGALGTGRLGRRKLETAQKHRIIKIGRNTEKSPGDLRRLTVTQTPAKNHDVGMKTLKGVK